MRAASITSPLTFTPPQPTSAFVYDHHWITLNDVHENKLCPKIEYVFGIGAESRNTPASLPEGYGYVVEEGVNWYGQIHLLRTEDLVPVGFGGAAEATKQCIECWYAPGKGPHCTPAQNGTFLCCGEACYDG